ncbi:conserved hypothetical protein [Leishmania braziliensis MHOM/BR/75/M2904]|uniref:Uncharacterized protein n=1 Tax=Leishmania braziliensis TaxID=5660 RepID=A4HIB1_LEIBR|nr:conserved hypothetical protein [Leishmania braziliensis MHOM/BR/75/M2904]KAI5689753.1 hypothetical protein MNV84_05921 [Leishmania braziliensis]CAJ2477203.1 unnamed protein product [Leishmania braziliensis]CAJ2477635.1 unnamed protein product [Leishmania braziliensis]CAM40321.1 conserved hypothetical protein [Leishmania braziliensis MHOM/BR/75/M2904]
MRLMLTFVHLTLDFTTSGKACDISVSVKDLERLIDSDHLPELCERVMPSTAMVHFPEEPKLSTPNVCWQLNRLFPMMFGCCMESEWQLRHKHTRSQRSFMHRVAVVTEEMSTSHAVL